jgi:hypothetical protein
VTTETSNLMAHAERELGNAGLAGEDGYDGMLVEAVLAHVRLFAEQGHSGFSASMTVSILERLLRFEPLSPLTGADDEWVALDYGPDLAAQNVRCGHVFRRANGTAYDGEGRVFIDPDGQHLTGPGSRVEVTFPYTPTRVFQHRDADGSWIDGPRQSTP